MIRKLVRQGLQTYHPQSSLFVNSCLLDVLRFCLSALVTLKSQCQFCFHDVSVIFLKIAPSLFPTTKTQWDLSPIHISYILFIADIISGKACTYRICWCALLWFVAGDLYPLLGNFNSTGTMARFTAKGVPCVRIVETLQFHEYTQEGN